MKINGFSYQELFNLAIQKPTLAQLEITQNCNQECSFCFKSCSYKKTFKDLPLTTWKKIVKTLADFGVENLNYTGGEVFVFKHFLDLVLYSKKQGIKKIVVNTNGTIPLDGQNLEPINTLVFSVHGLESQHDAIVGRQGAFKSLVRNLQLAKDKAAINVVVTPENIKNLDDILTYFIKFDLQFYSFNLAGSIDGGTVISEIFYKKYFSFLKRLQKRVGPKVLLRHGMQNIAINDRNFFEAKIPLPHCAAGKYKLLINYQGDVYPCSFFQNKNFYCGNILKGDLKKIWQSGKGFKFFRDQYLKKSNLPSECRTCFKKDKCGGGCFVWRCQNSKNKNIYDKDIRCEFGNAYSRVGNN